MGRISDAVDDDAPSESGMYVNIVDDILDGLDDDDDRRIVLAWLRSSMSNNEVRWKFHDHQLECSSSSIGNWRDAQRRGRGRPWDV